MNDQVVQNPMRKKRKVRTKKKKEYNGWGSTFLIRFLESIGKDTSKQMSQDDVTEIVNQYVKDNNLIHPSSKKKVVCDERLRSLFGRKKTIARWKIHDLLESLFAENYEESSDDMWFSNSEDDIDDKDTLALGTSEKQKKITIKIQSKMGVEKPKSCFAAIVPFNIRLVYLKRSLVEELLKVDPENFESKVVGGFVRIKCDPNDYLQKNTHQLLQVTGVKKDFGMNGKFVLQVSGFIKEISIHMLSDDNFSEEECKDLRQRVKDGLLKRLMIVELEKTARELHEDITKHWLAREILLLQNLIDRANEKGWRREKQSTLDEHLRKREKLQNSDEQARLLHEIPQVIADDLESEYMTPNVPDEKVEGNSEEFWQSKYTQASLVTEVPKAIADDFVCETKTLQCGSMLNSTVSADHHCYNIPVQRIHIVYKNDGLSKLAESNEVIKLMDDDGNEDSSTVKQIPAEQLYKDPFP